MSESTTPRDDEADPAHSPAPPSPHRVEPTSHQRESLLPSTTSEAATEGYKANLASQSNDAIPAGGVSNSRSHLEHSQMTNGTPPVTNGPQDERHEDTVAEDTLMEDQIGPSKDALEDYNWQELEDRFATRMMECQKKEEELGKEFKQWLEVFNAWASVTEIHEEERARKRLRTRMAYVQGKEQSLETKRQHYVKVVQAFESALALLADA